MKRQFVVNIVTTVGIAWLGLAGTPVFAQTSAPTGLNAELSQAVCQQDWARAIRVVDQMRAAAPSRQGDLALYRSRLQSMMSSQTVIPNWQCGANGTPSLATSPGTATPIRSSITTSSSSTSSPAVVATPNAPAPREAAPDTTVRGVRPGSSSSAGASSSGTSSSSTTGSGSSNIINRARNLNTTTSTP